MRRHISRRRWDGDDWHAEPSTTADLHRWVARGLVRRLSMASTFRGFTIAAIGLMLYLIGFHSMAIPYLQRMESTAGEVAIAASRRTHPRVAGRGWQGRDVYDSTAAAAVAPGSAAASAPDGPAASSGSATVIRETGAPDQLSPADCQRIESIAKRSIELRPTLSNQASVLVLTATFGVPEASSHSGAPSSGATASAPRQSSLASAFHASFQ